MRDSRINLRTSKKLKTALLRLATARGMSLSEYIEMVLEELVATQQDGVAG